MNGHNQSIVSVDSAGDSDRDDDLLLGRVAAGNDGALAELYQRQARVARS